MDDLAILILGGLWVLNFSVVIHALDMLHEVRVMRRRLLRAPRLTVRQVRGLDRFPKRVGLRAQTGPGLETAPLSALDCAWYRLEAGRIVTVGSNEGEALSARYAEAAPDIGLIPLADACDPDNVIWLSEGFAKPSLDRKLATLIAEPVREVVPFTQSAGAEAGWAFLRRLEAEGRLTAADLAPGSDAHALGVSEFVVPPDTPVLVIGRPVRSSNGVVIRPARGLSGVTTSSDPEIEARLASRVEFWRPILVISALMTVATFLAMPVIASIR